MPDVFKMVGAVLGIAALIFFIHETVAPPMPAHTAAPPSTGATDVSVRHDVLVSDDSLHVVVWRDDEAMKEGLKLISDGAARRAPQLMNPLIACLVESGTRVSTLSGGFFRSTVLVADGPWTGCRGVVDNYFYADANARRKIR